MIDFLLINGAIESGALAPPRLTLKSLCKVFLTLFKSTPLHATAHEDQPQLRHVVLPP